ncbi:MAG: hypothetical protein HYV26_20300 [Candidatus Hydrogenedentes bacterium]|nr:hypothetical protein [Candidatus Hydrogenedentota bacterium]
MNQVLAVVWAKLRMARHQVASVRHESRLKVGVITVAATTLWLGAFILFYEGFQYLLHFDIAAGAGELNLGDLLMGRMLSILALSVFVLLIFSNVLVAFSTLYRSREVMYLLQAPLRYEQFFHARFFECLAFSSWSLAFLGSPLMLAYGLSTGAGPAFYAATLLFFVPYIVVPACLGCIITLVLVRIFPRLQMPAMIVFACLSVLAFFFHIGRTLEDARAQEDAFLPAILDVTARTQSPLLPSYWASQGVLSAATFHLGDSLWYLLLLLSTALMGLLVAGKLSQLLFFPGWSYLMGQDRQRIRPMNKGLLAKLERVLGWVRNPERVLVMKDIKLFWRDPTQWSQFVIFFGIMAIYIANLRNTSNVYEKELWRGWIASLNVGALTLILSTLTSRFVFPLVSLEGRRFWILGLAPLTFRQLVWQKFWLSVSTTSLFTVSLAVLSGIMLNLEPVYFTMTIYTVAACNLGLAGLAVGLGALYPTFTEDNPARIVSGMGGTLNLLLSVGYITLAVAVQTVVLQARNLGLFQDSATFWYALAGSAGFITLLTAVCVAAPMRLGLRHLDQLEF